MTVLDTVAEFYRGWKEEKGYIGLSENGVPIPYFACEKTETPTVIFQYGIHAREYITCYLALMQAEDFLRWGKVGKVYFIPAVNPDGIAECIFGDGKLKANARGVDLNVNFDARWGTGEHNRTVSGSENYIGTHPFSESETAALRDFTLKVRPDATVSYHSKGEEIYWEFFQSGELRARTLALAERVSAVTGYPIKSAGVSAGGYKDWCAEKLRIPAITLEVGEDRLFHPIGKEHAGRIFGKNAGVVDAVTEYLWTNA